jgi:hypothetical protein
MAVCSHLRVFRSNGIFTGKRTKNATKTCLVDRYTEIINLLGVNGVKYWKAHS